MAKGFYLHHSGLWCIHCSITPVYDTALFSKISAIIHAKFQTNWFETVENKSNLKLISDCGLWCNASNASKKFIPNRF